MKRLALYGMVVLAVCMVALAAHDAFAYPDATEMRRFLMRWPWYTGGSVLLFVLLWFVQRKHKRD
jgi:hypothetical protein